MHITQLPDDVLSVLFDKIVGQQKDKVETWKDTLKLLAVCRQWRKVAEPWVYRWLYIIDTTILCNVPLELTSNLELIRSNKKLHLVRGIKIELWYSTFAHIFVNNILLSLKFDKLQWFKVTLLDIVLYSQYLTDGNDSQNNIIVSNIKYNSTSFARILIQNIPNVKKLRLRGNNQYVNALSSQLLAKYSAQLNYLSSDIAIPYSVKKFSDQLSYLKVQAGLLTIPNSSCIFAKSLRHLELEAIDFSFSWQTFNSEKKQNTIIFSNLVHLTLSFSVELNSNVHQVYIKSYLAHQQRCKAQFPKLQSLKVTLQSKHNILLSECLLPSHIEQVEILGMIWPVNFLQVANVRTIGKLSVSLSTDDFNIGEKLQLSNYLFGNLCIAKSTLLSLNHYLISSHVCRIEWTHLAELELFKGIYIQVMLELLAAAPSVVVFRAALVECSNITDHQSLKQMLAETRLMPGLSRSKLEVLRIEQFEENVLPETASLVADSLVQLFPTLQTIMYPTCVRVVRHLQ